jgi:hypothetical protein
MTHYEEETASVIESYLEYLTEFSRPWLGLRLRMLAICNQVRQKGKGKALPFRPSNSEGRSTKGGTKILGRPMESEVVEASLVYPS